VFLVGNKRTLILNILDFRSRFEINRTYGM
jgi:hypothetical protein